MTSTALVGPEAVTVGTAEYAPHAAPGYPRIPLRRTGLWTLGLAAAVTALAGSWMSIDSDSAQAVLQFAGRSVSYAGSLRWPVVAIVLALAAVHYCAASLALRATGGVRTRLTETLLVQFAAAAANRLTVGGIGAGAVNARFLSRRGLSVPASLGAVAAFGAVKGVTSLLTIVALVFGGAWLGFDAGTRQVGALTHHLAGMLHLVWLLPVAAGVLATISALSVSRRRRGKRLPDWRQLRSPAVDLIRSPHRLLMLVGCSAAMTLALALAFAATTAVFGGQASVGVGGLMIAYLLGGAAGNASLLPGGVGATEAALSALLVADHVPAAQSLQIVIFFRVLTFWLPAAIGLLATRHLARSHAL